MNKQRISIDIDIEKHKLLKIYCAQIGISMKKFIIDALDIQMFLLEDGNWVKVAKKEDVK